jgi:uroporphyrinogen-III synthase
MKNLRVLSLESRRSVEMAKLIANQGGIPVSAPSMREVPLEENPAAAAFAAGLLAARFDVIVFLTGVGARALMALLQKRYSRDELLEALRRAAVVPRGPKPLAVLREWAVPVAFSVPEPNTWRELLAEFDARRDAVPLAGRRLALQEYGVPNSDLVRELHARGAQVTTVPVYTWALPQDTAPLRDAVRAILAGGIDVVLVTSAQQVHHLFQVAAEHGDAAPRLRDTLRRSLLASIGPTSTACLQQYGLDADLEPSHPRMGILVKETAERADTLLAAKRAGRNPAGR